MKDLNFFVSYSEVSKDSKDIRYVVIGIAAIIAAFMFLSNAWYGINTLVLGGNIAKAKAQINSADLQKKYSQVQKLQEKQSILDGYSETASSLVKTADQKNIVTTEFLKAINGCMPADVYMSNISIAGSLLELNCTAKSMVTAAQFAHNITELQAVGSVSFSDINYDSAKKRYTVSLKCSLKDVVQDENK